ANAAPRASSASCHAPVKTFARPRLPTDVVGVRGGNRNQLLGPVSELDHSAELFSALARMPHQDQGSAMHIREAQARAKPESIGAKFAPPSAPAPLLGDREAPAGLPGSQIAAPQAVPNDHSQADVIRIVGEPNRLQERVQGFCESPGIPTDAGETVQDLA